MHEGGLGKRARTEDGYGMGGGGGYGSDYGSFPCVKLRGLPFDVSEEDVRQFLVRVVQLQPRSAGPFSSGFL